MKKKRKNWIFSVALSLILVVSAFSLLQAATLHRKDFVGSVESTNGEEWGYWQEEAYCNPGLYVRGLTIRVEKPQGSGDDTALNNIQLHCADRNGTVREKFMSKGAHEWGEWGNDTLCGYGDFLRGFALRVQPPQESGDDTAVNSIQFKCSDGTEREPLNGGTWGDWGEYQYCSPGSVVCGMSLRIEPQQGNGDDTAVNDVKFYCCEL